ncbi:D-alanyl-D-alanine carboxypeptidase family protein [Terrisporobacter sp.]
MRKIAAQNLEKMFKAAEKDRIGLCIVSVYRSSDYPKNVYNNSLQKNGKEFTEKYVSKPNHSEVYI